MDKKALEAFAREASCLSVDALRYARIIFIFVSHYVLSAMNITLCLKLSKPFQS
ncbi:hypothetical protein ACSTIN_12870 [Vibrio parahaemolyticus]